MARPRHEGGGSGRIEMVGWAAFLIRCTVSVTFLAHGLQKIVILGWERGVPSFRSWGIPVAEVAYSFTVVVETGGGLLLLAGLGVRPAAAAPTAVMLGALFTMHLRHGFFLPQGFEFVLVLGTACVAIALLGPGGRALERRLPFGSLERWLSRRNAGSRRSRRPPWQTGWTNVAPRARVPDTRQTGRSRWRHQLLHRGSTTRSGQVPGLCPDPTILPSSGFRERTIARICDLSALGS